MDMVPDDETEGFSFIWTIQNFKYCLQKQKEYLSSPCFKLDLSDTTKWNLNIFPRGHKKDNTIGIFLNVESSGPLPIEVKNHFSIRATNGTFKRIKDVSTSFSFKNDSSLGISCFLDHSDLFKKGECAFLENDMLTLRCRIWKEHPEPSVSGRCYARTVIDVKRIAFDWTLDNFKELLHNGKKTINFNPAGSEKKYFKVAIFLAGEIYNEKKIQVEIKQNEPYQKSFLTCKLSLLDADGKTVQSVHSDHWFEVSPESSWHFPFMPLKKVLENEKLYLVNGALPLRCEFAVSSDEYEQYSTVESTEYGVINEHDNACYKKTVDARFPGTWKDNLLHFYKEGKFSDLTIRTESSKEFHVHKTVLCAWSEVFSAMFEHDTKENQTGVVEIKDLNDDIVSKMLLFIYSDNLEDLEWEAATELYFAADKYGIEALKRECSIFLKGKLNTSNVCEVLVLADLHQDQDMKLAAQDFVMDNATEIINSDYWKKFIREQSNLAAETLQVLFMRNLKF